MASFAGRGAFFLRSLTEGRYWNYRTPPEGSIGIYSLTVSFWQAACWIDQPVSSGVCWDAKFRVQKWSKFMERTLLKSPRRWNRALGLVSAFFAILCVSSSFQPRAAAQDQDDPPGRVARLGYMEGSVSFQPAGENEWVEATPNRPMTTGDKLWADRDSRAEVQLGSATINLAPNTGFSFLNLDDRTIQIELSSGSLNVRVWNVDRDNVFEIDTANQAFSVYQPGRYRLDASEDGNSTVVTVRQGEGESTGNGQSYTMHAGQRFTFSGTTSLNAQVDEIGGSDDFDHWSDGRERRYQDSPSARYCSRRVVGFEDLDDNGDWRSTPDYGYAWFPRVEAGWAPYHDGHWAWIDPWGWTWVDDARWGYAPFHYGRWASIGGRWGWIPGPVEERPVYAPALVAFVGGGFAVGGTVAWFPLGPREVYVPSYRVSPTYVNRVNISNTTVNQTTVTNVYNTTIVNNNTTINNVTYVNRNVQGGVTAVPQRSFASAQPVARNAVAVNQSQLRAGSVSARAAVPPAREAVMGPHANTANRVAAPPQQVATRQVVAKAAPPPPPPSFAARQQVLTQHPGQPVARQEMQKMRPANAPQQMVRQAPPAKPATPTPAAANRPGNQPGNPAANTRPGGNPPPAAQPAPANQPGANNRPGASQPGQPPARNDRPGFNPPNNRPQPNQPSPNNRPEPNAPPTRNDRPPSAQPDNRPQPNQPAPNNRPEPNSPPARNDRPPSAQPNNRPQPNQPEPNNRPEPNAPPARNERPPSAQPNNRPETTPPAPNNRPESARPSEPPARNDRPPSAQPNNRPDPNQPRANQPLPPENRPNPARPETNRPQPNQPEPPARNERPSEQPRTEPAPRPQNPPPSERPQSRPPAEARPAPQDRPQPKQTPEEKKRQDQQKKQQQDQRPQ